MKLTQAQLSALPELPNYTERLLPDGTTVRERAVPRFCVHKTQGDDVLLFVDAEGSWMVEWHIEGGPYKRRAPF